MRVLIVGASQGIGLEATRQALAAGHQVRALSRSAATMAQSDPRLEKVVGDALKREDMESAVSGVDAVIQTLGVGVRDLFRPVSLFSEATRVLIAAMQGQRIQRLICVTGFGAGDSESSIGCLQRVPFQLAFGRAYADKSVQEQLIKDSELEWTIVRPGVLTSGKARGRYQVLVDARSWRNGLIARADVAAFLVAQLQDRRHLHHAPVLVY